MDRNKKAPSPVARGTVGTGLTAVTFTCAGALRL